MKFTRLFFLLLFSFGAENSIGIEFSELTIEVINIANTKGDVYISLYDSADGFPVEEQKAIAVKSVKLGLGDSTSVKVTFSGLNEGYYAAAAYHDKNTNGRLDKIFGIPREPYGATNDSKRKFSAPSFADAKIKINSNEKSFNVIDMQ
ncbi:MAG: DUF2141 domain-containing protein [Pseudomonadales bacterium]|nr:DUF2141 domain-containing protein [Pseudomonadales bacterium]